MNLTFFVRTFLVVLNVIFLIFGAILIAIGSYAINNLNVISQLVNTGLPVGLIIIGVFVFILSFFGCCGASFHNRFMLLIYVFILLGLMICQIALAVASSNQRDKFQYQMKGKWDSLDNQTKLYFESKFSCCGYSYPEEEPECVAQYGFTTSCSTFLEKFFKDNMTVVFNVSVIFGALEVAGFFFALVYYCSIARPRSREPLLS
eukprot:TRINITY_DN5660_c0_g1_i2.p1 TRINITY_DN5660_c0_g1~~TRINITY_DN5660_c0_g1_i2.p1  ORF type:complete len:204 (-),score=9.04 TRINITY_DN5660_c0_g1_i2:90-701(-)